MEILDIYDDNGKVTGKTVIRGDKSAKIEPNEHIAVGIIFIENDNGEFLIQKTSKEKGGEYSSTGGHITHGETPLESIKREVQEELGVNIDEDNIIELGFLNYDLPIRFMFYLKKNIDVKTLKLQIEEVESANYLSVDDIKQLIDENKMLKSHAIIFNEILKYKEDKTKYYELKGVDPNER